RSRVRRAGRTASATTRCFCFPTEKQPPSCRRPRKTSSAIARSPCASSSSSCMPQITLERPGRVELAVLPPLALYVHIPWCVRKCPYCDFNSHERAAPLPEDQYVAKLLADLEGLLPSVWAGGSSACSSA